MTNNNKTNKPEIDNNATYSPDAIAAILNIDAKSVRRHLRSLADLHTFDKPGRGGSWAVKGDMVNVIKERIESRSSGKSVTVSAADLIKG